MRNSTCYKLAKAKTFRRSSSKILPERNKADTGWGSNLENVEKSLRTIYIADGLDEDKMLPRCAHFLETGDYSLFSDEELSKLRVLLQPDQSGAEALIVAYDTDHRGYRDLFLNKVKPHVFIGLHLFPEDWKRKIRELSIAADPDDVDTLRTTEIPSLKLNPSWKEIESLIKLSDYWPANERYYYLSKQTCHCMDGKTEVLTKHGWKAMSAYNKTDPIAIWKEGKITFETPFAWNVSQYSGDMYYFSGDEVDQLVTPEHKIIYNSNSINHIGLASSVANLKRVNIPTSGVYSGSTNLPSWQVKLLVAIQADGYWNTKTGVRFRLVKQRKIDRLLSILKEGNVTYIKKHGGITSVESSIVEIEVFNLEDTLKFFNGSKLWDSWLLELSKNNLETFVEELSYWDGSYTESFLHKREFYCSSLKQNIEWAKTVCHLVNKQGTLGKEEHGNIKLGINNRQFSIAQHKLLIKNWQGTVYCPTVSSGAFLVRRAGKISVTHNSGNYDIQWGTFQMNILEKSGGKVVISKEQAREFLEMYRGLFPEIPERNERIKKQVNDTHIIYNLFGFPYTITSHNIKEHDYKQFYAWGPQSTVAEINRTAFSDIYYYAEEHNLLWDNLNDCHDSILEQVPLPDAREAAKKLTEFIGQEFTSPIDGMKFKMKSEIQIGFNWGPFYKDYNPLGLREVKWLI